MGHARWGPTVTCGSRRPPQVRTLFTDPVPSEHPKRVAGLLQASPPGRAACMRASSNGSPGLGMVASPPWLPSGKVQAGQVLLVHPTHPTSLYSPQATGVPTSHSKARSNVGWPDPHAPVGVLQLRVPGCLPCPGAPHFIAAVSVLLCGALLAPRG